MCFFFISVYQCVFLCVCCTSCIFNKRQWTIICDVLFVSTGWWPAHQCWDAWVIDAVQVKKVQKTQEREERIREQDAANELSARNIEDDKLTRILRSRGLALFEVALVTVILKRYFAQRMQILRWIFFSLRYSNSKRGDVFLRHIVETFICSCLPCYRGCHAAYVSCKRACRPGICRASKPMLRWAVWCVSNQGCIISKLNSVGYLWETKTCK